MRTTLDIHSPPTATASDYRDGAAGRFVTLDLDDPGGSTINFYFTSRAALLGWLDLARLAAEQLPVDERAPAKATP